MLLWMVNNLQLKDGDVVVLHSDDDSIFQIPEAYFVQEGAKRIYFWLFKNRESLRVLTDEDKAFLRRQLDG